MKIETIKERKMISCEMYTILSIQMFQYTVDSRYLEIEGTLKNSSRYPYFDISDL